MFVLAKPLDPRAKEIVALLSKFDLSNRWLAAKVGASHTNVNNWLSEEGNRPRNDDVYADMLRIVKEQGPKERNVQTKRAMVRLVPVYASIPAGMIPGSFSMDVEYEEMIDWNTDFERWGRIVSGYSMADILIPGDIAIFENREFETGDVVHAFKDGEDCIKAIRGNGENAQLWSFNEDYEPFSAAGWKAKGVCVARIRYGMLSMRGVQEFPHGLKWAMRHEKF